jgi:cyclopropane-fatty-acyl-phospholipid synthase
VVIGEGSHSGASAAAIRAHYDVGNDFYRLWLDETMTYSAAMWRDERDTSSLADAQRRKIAWHLHHSEANRVESLLDIGCGWGGLLRAAATMRAEGAPQLVRATGLTLSDAQVELSHQTFEKDGLGGAISRQNVDIRLESWIDHDPAEPYGAIVSIGAFEHFTRPQDDPVAKTRIYRDFFAHCRDWLKSDGRMTLQTIAYGDPNPNAKAASFMADIFPDSDLPSLGLVLNAVDGLFEIERVRNDRVDYARTCDSWASNLHARRAEAVALVGAAQTRRYERYLKLSAWGFWSNHLHLLRFKLKRR